MIAREGLPFISVGLFLTIVLILVAVRYSSHWFFGLSILLAILTLFTTYFFRDPDRSFAARENILVAPADGKIVQIKEIANHPFIGGPAVQISIFLSVFDVHINRVPADGVVEYVKYNPGKFLAAFEDKASELNEQTEIGIKSSSGEKLVVRQIAGMIARRIVCRLKQGEAVSAGERFGLIRFGSRTDLIIPATSEIKVELGQQVTGGETVMGYLRSEVVSGTLSEGKNVEL